jgi:uncharacterized coiled-coil protein SlyX
MEIFFEVLKVSFSILGFIFVLLRMESRVTRMEIKLDEMPEIIKESAKQETKIIVKKFNYLYNRLKKAESVLYKRGKTKKNV